MLSIRYSLILIGALLTGCSTSSALHQARLEYSTGAPLQALKTLENADVSKRDALLLLLDRGAIAFSAGQYSIAKESLLDASELIETWDQIRVGEQSASLVTNEWATRYRGEYSEQLWIHSYLMMVFLMQGNPESAAVEARRALQRMDKYTKPLKNDWFTRALIALSFEAAGAHDSTQVEYRKLASDKTYDGRWNNAIQRHTRRLGRDPIQAVKATPSLANTPTKLGNDEGELIVFLQSGQMPGKLAGDLALDLTLHVAFPYYPEFSDAQQPTVSVLADGITVPFDRIDTELLNVSKRALSARGKNIALKQVARIAAKKAVVDAASKENEAAGAVLQILAFATEQADVRSWETLPAWFSLVRIPLPEGEQSVVLNVNHSGVDHRVDLGRVTIKRQQLNFATFRTNQPLPLRDGQYLQQKELEANPSAPIPEPEVPQSSDKVPVSSFQSASEPITNS